MAADNIGPTMVLTVPPIRKSFGWKPAERIPTTFPCEFKSSSPSGMNLAGRVWELIRQYQTVRGRLLVDMRIHSRVM